jgi:hypothetical protein
MPGTKESDSAALFCSSEQGRYENPYDPSEKERMQRKVKKPNFMKLRCQLSEPKAMIETTVYARRII